MHPEWRTCATSGNLISMTLTRYQARAPLSEWSETESLSEHARVAQIAMRIAAFGTGGRADKERGRLLACFSLPVASNGPMGTRIDASWALRTYGPGH